MLGAALMIYFCDYCCFTFQRAGQIDDCPNCGKPAVREATEEEQGEYHKTRSEWEMAEQKKGGNQ